jgi:hypothetical protein
VGEGLDSVSGLRGHEVDTPLGHIGRSEDALALLGEQRGRRQAHTFLCNTSLNFKERGFINTITDLSEYAVKHNLDGFVVEGRTYLLKSSRRYQEYLRLPNMAADLRIDSLSAS